jgi:hypothetical protein
MKPLLLFLFLSLSLAGFGQDNLSFIEVGRFEPTRHVIFMSEKAELDLDFSGDSLVVSGNMKLTEAAEKFIEFVGQSFKTKIDSLKDELEECRKDQEIDSAYLLSTWQGSIATIQNPYLHQEPDPVYDTVAVWLECADTSKPISYNMTQPGYEVKEYGGSYWGGADPNPDGIVLAVAVRREIWNHVTYLDHFKNPIPFLVWGVKERKEK